jgi:hypothetical protein
MKEKYHRAITEQALRPHFSSDSLESIVQANLRQDAIRYQFGYDHFHYDNNSFAAADAYITEQRRAVIDALQNGADVSLARAAFGRLIHTAQDFYAHSNYTALWRERHSGAAPDQIHPQLAEVIGDSRLKSGRLYYPLELFAFIPLFKPLILPLLPHDSHAWVNKDDPGQPDFDYAYTAAVKRTILEFECVRDALSLGQAALFTGR